MDLKLDIFWYSITLRICTWMSRSMIHLHVKSLTFLKQESRRSRARSGSPVREESNALFVSKHRVPKMKSQCSEVDSVVPQNSVESGQLMCISKHREDPCYSTSLEFDQSHGVDGTMKIVNGDLKVFDYGSHIFENDAIVHCKYTMFEGIFSMAAALDISELEMSGRSTNLDEAYKAHMTRLLL
ncbi:hypothetical protein glysoja_035921 [Glycine soja]|uniref:Uncharacterized protein n=1 Tax=Glycine soja TaxID=3848 RepID=A0A0B2RBZ2_GLYSO|nr:hypothetical protein glysoja_035921 [Glycine soja]